jgi:hypothetical protein
MEAVQPLHAFLPTWEFSERHAVELEAVPEQVDRALRSVSIEEIPAIRLLYLLRGLGRATHDTGRPFLGLLQIGAVPLVDMPGEGAILGLTGQFWRLRGGREIERPRDAEEFIAYDRPDVCKAVIDFRIAEVEPGRCRLTTETRVHVEDLAARRAFRRYWLVVRPFSGLTRILFLRAVSRQARLM